MKVAFSVAVLATLALAYSVFMHDGGIFNSNKQCNLRLTSATLLEDGSDCSSCCASGSKLEYVKSESIDASSCCSTSQCCQDKATTVAVSADAGECCQSTCSTGEGKSWCQDKATTVAVSAKAGECCQDKCATEAIAKQDGQCTACPSQAAVAVTSQDGKASCPVATAMDKLPKMTFKVGTEATCCSKAAATLAEKSKEAIHYVVADKDFTCQQAAFTALVEETETFVNNFIAPAKCEHSGKTFVTGEAFECCDAAGKRTELVSAAIKDITVSYKVGEQSACCKNAAEALAKESSETIEYVVAEQTTPCELNARLMAAHKKYEAAVKAVLVDSAKTDVSTDADVATKSGEKVDG